MRENAFARRIDAATNKITATLAVGPADSEGGITVSGDSVWLVTGKNGTLARIDPATNTDRENISIAAGSYNPLYHDGVVWITGFDRSVLPRSTRAQARCSRQSPSARSHASSRSAAAQCGL